MRKFFEKSHNQLLNLKEVMVNILTIKKKYWVTCPYPEYLLNDTFKIVYICALPLVFYLIFLTKAYSVLMSTLIVLFKTIIVLLPLFRILAPTLPCLSRKSEESHAPYSAWKHRKRLFATITSLSRRSAAQWRIKWRTWSGCRCLNGGKSDRPSRVARALLYATTSLLTLLSCR